MSVTPHSKEVKKAVKRELHPNIFTYSKYKFSPYSACEHGCIYCDGRAEKYFVQGNFEKDIVVRENINDLLQEEIGSLREKGIISIGSGITDVYQPLEEKKELMRKAAAILCENEFPVCVLTKSQLAQRDLDLWSVVNEKNGFILLITITTLNEDLRKKFEPNASSVNERLNLISSFKAKGCMVGVLVMPVLPFITDDQAALTELVQEVKKRGADFVMPGCLTLRPGKQKNYYMNFIDSSFRSLTNKYLGLYAGEYSSGAPDHNYINYIYKMFFDILKKHDLPFFLSHEYYKGLMPIYDEIYLLLNQMKEIYSCHNIDVSRLEKASSNYFNWLEKEKKTFNRKRSLNSRYISDKLEFMAQTNHLSKIFENDKLSEFVKDVIINKRVFDPMDCRLV